MSLLIRRFSITTPIEREKFLFKQKTKALEKNYDFFCIQQGVFMLNAFKKKRDKGAIYKTLARKGICESEIATKNILEAKYPREPQTSEFFKKIRDTFNVYR